MTNAASQAPPSRRRHTARDTTTSTTGVNRAVAYLVALAAARMIPAATSRAVRVRNG